MSSNTAKIVLKNQTLRWSSPKEFNDPFDVPRELSFGFEASEIKQALVKCLVDLIKKPPEDTDNLNPKIKLIIDAIKKADSDELKSEIVSAIDQEPDEEGFRSIGLEQMRELWRSWVPQFRILCLCESHKKASMWYHYADRYKGVVIELNCSDELDSAWLAAKPVSYSETVPEIFTPIGWAKLLLMPQQHAIRTLYETFTYTKTPDWGYEKEWRVASFKRPSETGTVSDYKLDHREFRSIYLGPLIDPNEREKIIELIQELMPHIEVHETEFGMNRCFNFKRVNL